MKGVLRAAGRGVLWLPAYAALVPLLVYRAWISPLLGPHCRYTPSCSSYAVTALRSWGPLGFALITWRLVRCQPWGGQGPDPVPSPPWQRAHTHAPRAGTHDDGYRPVVAAGVLTPSADRSQPAGTGPSTQGALPC